MKNMVKTLYSLLFYLFLACVPQQSLCAHQMSNEATCERMVDLPPLSYAERFEMVIAKIGGLFAGRSVGRRVPKMLGSRSPISPYEKLINYLGRNSYFKHLLTVELGLDFNENPLENYTLPKKGFDHLNIPDIPEPSFKRQESPILKVIASLIEDGPKISQKLVDEYKNKKGREKEYAFILLGKEFKMLVQDIENNPNLIRNILDTLQTSAESCIRTLQALPFGKIEKIFHRSSGKIEQHAVIGEVLQGIINVIQTLKLSINNVAQALCQGPLAKKDDEIYLKKHIHQILSIFTDMLQNDVVGLLDKVEQSLVSYVNNIEKLLTQVGYVPEDVAGYDDDEAYKIPHIDIEVEDIKKYISMGLLVFDARFPLKQQPELFYPYILLFGGISGAIAQFLQRFSESDIQNFVDRWLPYVFHLKENIFNFAFKKIADEIGFPLYEQTTDSIYSIMGGPCGTLAMIPGWVLGGKLAARHIARKYNVTATTFHVCREFNINCGQYYQIIKASEEKDFSELQKGISSLYHKRFGSRWGEKINNLFFKYDNYAQYVFKKFKKSQGWFSWLPWRRNLLSDEEQDEIRLIELGAALHTIYFKEKLPGDNTIILKAKAFYKMLGF